MRTSIIASFVALAASVSALEFTYPTAENATLDLSVSNTITWKAVSTDPKTVALYLTNQATFPPVNITLAATINTGDLKYTLEPLSGPALQKGYQFNFVKPATAEQSTASIAAQSPQFEITKVKTVEASKTATSSTPSATEAAPAATSSKASGAGALVVGGWSLLGAAGLVAALL